MVCASLHSVPLPQQLVLCQQLLAGRSLDIVARLYLSRVLVELALLLAHVLRISVVALCLRYFVGVIQVLLLNVRVDLVACATDDLAR